MNLSQVSSYIKNFPFPTLREKQSFVLNEIDMAFASGYKYIVLEVTTGSTRHVSEITAIESEFGNSAKIIVPTSWLGRRVIHLFIQNIFQNILRREGKQMSSEVLLSNVIPFAGSGLLGYALGFALKKILKWMLIIVGFLAGMFFLGIQLLQKYGYVEHS